MRVSSETSVFEGDRPQRLLARLARARALQLSLAARGRVVESARMAARAAVLRAALGGAAAAGAGVALTPTPAAAQAAASVRTAEVTEEVVRDHRRVTGSLQAVSRSAVAAREGGAVERVLVDEGSEVRAGQVLATLDGRRLRAQLEEAGAERASHAALAAQREAELRFAELDLARVRSAYEQSAANERELSEAQTLVGVRSAQLDSARRLVEQAERRAELLEIRLADMAVTAPFDARVVARHVEPGEWIEQGRPVVTLVSVGTIEARLEVPERFAASVMGHDGTLYVAVATDGRTVRSLGVRPVREVDPRARTFRVIATLDNADGSLTPGMAVDAWVPTSDETLALLAPRDAVVRDGRDAYVFRTGGEGETRAERTPVRVLFGWGDRVAVASDGLRAGDMVVVEGNERLSPGATVTVASGE